MKLPVVRSWSWLAAIALSQLASAQDCVTAPKGLVAWWRGEGSPASLFDLSPPVATGVTYAPGRVGQALVLGSVGAGVDLGSSSLLDVQDFTVHAWVRRASADAVASDGAGVGWILARAAGGFGFGLAPDGRLQLQVVGGPGSVLSSAAIIDTDFHHVAVVRSGETVAFYVDGAAVGGGAHPVMFGYGGQTAIGRRGEAGTGSFAGQLDEVAFFDRVLPAATVAAFHAAGAAGMCLPAADVANDLPVATERLIQGNPSVGNVTATSDRFAIDGLLRIESAGGGYLSAIAITSGVVTSREGGVISIRRGAEGPRGFNGPLINRGTFEARWPVTLSAPGGNVVNLGP